MFLSFLPNCIASITAMNMTMKPPQVKTICITQPDALLGNSANSSPVQWSSAQNQLPFPWHCRYIWLPSGFFEFGQGGMDRPVEVQFASAPIKSHGQQINFQLPHARIAIGWKLVMTADSSINSVGRWTCRQEPLRVCLQRQYMNWTKLNMIVNMIATWKP